MTVIMMNDGVDDELKIPMVMMKNDGDGSGD